MKKKIYGAVVAIGLAAMVAFSLNINSDTNDISTLTMNNIEALADGESGTVIPCKNKSGETCSFPCTTGDGSGVCSITEMIKI